MGKVTSLAESPFPFHTGVLRKETTKARVQQKHLCVYNNLSRGEYNTFDLQGTRTLARTRLTVGLANCVCENLLLVLVRDLSWLRASYKIMYTFTILASVNVVRLNFCPRQYMISLTHSLTTGCRFTDLRWQCVRSRFCVKWSGRPVF